MKKLKLLLAVISIVSISVYSCKKEGSDASSPAIKTNVRSNVSTPLVLNGVSYTEPYCTLAHGNSCIPDGFTCLLRFPPDQGATTGVGINFYEPEENGVGETGTQMVMEFLSPIDGIENGVLGPEEDEAATIDVYTELANALNCNGITIINKKYYPVMSDPDHPYGYVYMDCTVQ